MDFWRLLFDVSILDSGPLFLLLKHEVRQLGINNSFSVRVVYFVVDPLSFLPRLTFSECSLFDAGDLQIFTFQESPRHLESQPYYLHLLFRPQHRAHLLATMRSSSLNPTISEIKETSSRIEHKITMISFRVICPD